MKEIAKFLLLIYFGIHVFAIKIIKFEKNLVANETFVNRERLPYGSSLLDCYTTCSKIGSGCNACRIISDSGTKLIERGILADVKTLTNPNELIYVLVQTPKKGNFSII